MGQLHGTLCSHPWPIWFSINKVTKKTTYTKFPANLVAKRFWFTEIRALLWEGQNVWRNRRKYIQHNVVFTTQGYLGKKIISWVFLRLWHGANGMESNLLWCLPSKKFKRLKVNHPLFGPTYRIAASVIFRCFLPARKNIVTSDPTWKPYIRIIDDEH